MKKFKFIVFISLVVFFASNSVDAATVAKIAPVLPSSNALINTPFAISYSLTDSNDVVVSTANDPVELRINNAGGSQVYFASTVSSNGLGSFQDILIGTSSVMRVNLNIPGKPIAIMDVHMPVMISSVYGGRINASDTFAYLEIPPGALTYDFVIEMKPQPAVFHAPSTILETRDYQVTIKDNNEGVIKNLELLRQATLVIMYFDTAPADGIVDDPSPKHTAIKISGLVIGKEKPGTLDLAPIGDSYVDIPNSRVIGKIDAFNTGVNGAGGNGINWYGLMGIPAATPALSISNLFNYPNPFTDSTQIVFLLDNTFDSIKLDVFTLGGRLVREIDAGIGVAGRNVINWDGKDKDGNEIPNGAYIGLVKGTKGSETKSLKFKICKLK